MTDGSGTGNDGSIMALVTTRVSWFDVWTKNRNWEWRKLQVGSTIGEEIIDNNVNKLKENVLKRGYNHDEGEC